MEPSEQRDIARLQELANLLNPASDAPPETGIPFHWKRHKEIETPKWALIYFEEVQEMGLLKHIAQRKSGTLDLNKCNGTKKD